MGRRVSALSVLFCIFAFNRSAEAQSPRINLKWRAPQACQRASVVQRRVEHALHGSDAPKGRFVVTLESSSAEDVAYVLRFEGKVERERSARRLEVATCQDAEKAASLFIVLSLDPAGAARLTNAEQVRTPSTETAKRKPAAMRARALGHEGRFLLGTGMSLQSGVLAPSFAPGWGVSAAAELRGVRARIAGEGLFARTSFPREGEALAIRLHAWSGTLTLAYFWHWGRWTFGPELAGQFLSVKAKRQDPSALQSGSIQFFTLGAGGRTEFALTRHVGASFFCQVVVPTARPSFLVAPVGAVFEPSFLGIHGGFEFIFNLPFTNLSGSGH